MLTTWLVSRPSATTASVRTRSSLRAFDPVTLLCWKPAPISSTPLQTHCALFVKRSYGHSNTDCEDAPDSTRRDITPREVLFRPSRSVSLNLKGCWHSQGSPSSRPSALKPQQQGLHPSRSAPGAQRSHTNSETMAPPLPGLYIVTTRPYKPPHPEGGLIKKLWLLPYCESGVSVLETKWRRGQPCLKNAWNNECSTSIGGERYGRTLHEAASIRDAANSRVNVAQVQVHIEEHDHSISLFKAWLKLCRCTP